MLELYLRIVNALKREEGQDMAEYALLLALIAVIVAAALPAVQQAITGTFGDIAALMP